jgi:hypothetical protein
MEPTKLPKTIVIPASAYRESLRRLVLELWDDGAWKRLSEDKTDPWDRLTTDDLRWQANAMRRLWRERRFWLRRELLARWPADAQQMLHQAIESRFSTVESHPAVRVSAVRFASWLLNDPCFVADESKIENDRIARLMTISGQCDWLASGGDAEVARLLGLWVEDVVADNES